MEKEPVVGSIWRARDGRIMRVQEIVPASRFSKAWVLCSVLNAGPRMRRQTTMGLNNFGVGRFLNFHAANDAALSSPRHPRELTP